MRSSAYDVFMIYAPRDILGKSRIISKECYDHWLRTRPDTPREPERSFSKALIGHGKQHFQNHSIVRGSQNKKPFSPELETIILAELRQPRVWPCFEDSTNQSVRRIGTYGMKQLGHHERLGQFPVKIGVYNILKDKCCENMNTLLVNESYLYQRDTVLSSFTDVTSTEVASVLLFKELAVPIFLKHYSGNFPVSLNVVGDLRLLRLLRFHKFETSKALVQLEEDIYWRKAYDLDNVAKTIIENDFSYETLREQTIYFETGGRFPFFHQLENGDLLDYHILLRQIARSEDYKLGLFHTYTIVAEYRSLVLTKISLSRKRVAKFVVLFEWKNVKEEVPDFFFTQPMQFLSWFDSFEHNKKVLNSIMDLYIFKYCYTLENISILGCGEFFHYFASKVARWLNPEYFDLFHFVCNKEERNKLLKELIGPMSQWPYYYDKGGTNPRRTPVVNTALSLYN